ncbi:hypothetical protein F2Q69_00058237 [Brassica cretica]|uniref:Uncharacterized protein n=1 Tax=Brassica cretica TaxID=69181 RepID=A0A8S9RCH8_BRACR|nr:hypothetical protein F2Q69_00058237 [Brassica cretica]
MAAQQAGYEAQRRLNQQMMEMMQRMYPNEVEPDLLPHFSLPLSPPTSSASLSLSLSRDSSPTHALSPPNTAPPHALSPHHALSPPERLLSLRPSASSLASRRAPPLRLTPSAASPPPPHFNHLSCRTISSSPFLSSSLSPPTSSASLSLSLSRFLSDSRSLSAESSAASRSLSVRAPPLSPPERLLSRLTLSAASPPHAERRLSASSPFQSLIMDKFLGIYQRTHSSEFSEGSIPRNFPMKIPRNIPRNILTDTFLGIFRELRSSEFPDEDSEEHFVGISEDCNIGKSIEISRGSSPSVYSEDLSDELVVLGGSSEIQFLEISSEISEEFSRKNKFPRSYFRGLVSSVCR